MVESKLEEHLVSRSGILPSLPGASIVNLMWGSTKRVSTGSFYYTYNIIYISFPPRVGMGH